MPVASWRHRPATVNGESALVHLRRRKYQALLLTPAPPAATATEAPSSATVSFSADREVDALAERARSTQPVGRSAIVGPVDTPWNTLDLRVTDPAGHRLVFTERNPNPDPEQVARMQEMFDRSREGRPISVLRVNPSSLGLHGFCADRRT